MSISIITAIHNSLAMNRLYWSCLVNNTFHPFELIILDNHSTDGSEFFFQELSKKEPGKIRYIRNEKNRSYPASQNQGMHEARYPYLCFLNNDLWLPKNWDLPIVEALKENSFQVISPSGIEAQPFQSLSTRLKNRWKRVCFFSKVWRRILFKTEEERLWKSLEWMYGNLENFKSPTPQNSAGYFYGIKGDSVCFHRDLETKLGFRWDERVEAADWHLYLTLAKKHNENPAIPLPKVLLNCYSHHFGRYSARQEFEPLELKEPFLKIEEIWSAEEIKKYWWGNFLPR